MLTLSQSDAALATPTVDASAKPAAAGHIAGLDGLRGVAALVVLGGHLTASIVAVTGVYLFFILSAFLLMSQFLRWRPADFLDWRRWGHYGIRRSFRVLPLFALVACLSALTTALGLGLFGGAGFPMTVEPAILADVLTLRAGPEVLWSIPVEFKFYLVLPILAALVVVAMRGWLWGAVWVLAGLALASRLAFAPDHHDLSVAPFLTLFITGCLVAVLHCLFTQRLASGSARAIAARRWTLELTAWAMVVGWALTMPLGQSLLIGAGLERRMFIVSHGLYAVLFGTMVLAVLHGRGVMRWMLEWRPMRWVGAVSFSLYLWHKGPIMAFDALGMPSKVGGVLAILVSFAIAGASYRWFEKPILEATRHWLRPKRRPVEAMPDADPIALPEARPTRTAA